MKGVLKRCKGAARARCAGGGAHRRRPAPKEGADGWDRRGRREKNNAQGSIDVRPMARGGALVRGLAQREVALFV